MASCSQIVTISFVPNKHHRLKPSRFLELFYFYFWVLDRPSGSRKEIVSEYRVAVEMVERDSKQLH